MAKQVDVAFIEKDGVQYLTFTKWQDQQLIHAFSTREGGVSDGIFSSMNLGFNRGDETSNVKENYRRMAQVLNTSIENMVLSRQVHELEIAKVTASDKGNGITKANQWQSKDGLYTTETGITLVTHYADCVPLFFYASKSRLVGLAHAGWRGTVGEIGKKMIECWTQEEGVSIEEIEVAIGPSIGPCCFEVGPEVAEQFMKQFDQGATFISGPKADGKYHIDLWECNRQSLLHAGIKEDHIMCSKLCTCCHHETFFSHRYTKGQRGTLAAFIELK